MKGACLNSKSVEQILLGFSEDLKKMLDNHNRFGERLTRMENLLAMGINEGSSQVDNVPNFPLDNLDDLENPEELLVSDKEARSATVCFNPYLSP